MTYNEAVLVAALILVTPLDMKAILGAPVSVLEARWGKASHWETWEWQGSQRRIPSFSETMGFRASQPKLGWKQVEYGDGWGETLGLQRDGLRMFTTQYSGRQPDSIFVVSSPHLTASSPTFLTLYRAMTGHEAKSFKGDPSIETTTFTNAVGTWEGVVCTSSSHPERPGVTMMGRYKFQRKHESETSVSDLEEDGVGNASCTLDLAPSDTPESIYYRDIPRTSNAHQALRLLGIDTKGFPASPRSGEAYPFPSLKGWTFTWFKLKNASYLRFDSDESCPYRPRYTCQDPWTTDELDTP